MVLSKVFNLKQLTDWPYSKIALMAALKQPLEWWTETKEKMSKEAGTPRTAIAAREKCSPFTFLNLAVAVIARLQHQLCHKHTSAHK